MNVKNRLVEICENLHLNHKRFIQIYNLNLIKTNSVLKLHFVFERFSLKY